MMPLHVQVLGLMTGISLASCTHISLSCSQQQGRRMSQRSTKRPKYNVDADSGEEDENGNDESDGDDEGGFQRLKRRPQARTPSQAPEQNAAQPDAGPSQPGPSRWANPSSLKDTRFYFHSCQEWNLFMGSVRHC